MFGGGELFTKKCYFCTTQAGVAQLVEHQLPKLRVAGPSPVSRSIKRSFEGTTFIFL